MFSAQDATLEVGGYTNITIPPGPVTLRADRIVEARKDGSTLADNEGDEYNLMVFEALDGSGQGGDVSQRIYLDPENCNSQKGSQKLARTRWFVGNFLKAAGVSTVESAEALIGLVAKARITHSVNGEKTYVNIAEWLSQQSNVGGGGMSSNRFEQDQQRRKMTEEELNDVPF